jgi:hypothetical protein
MKLIVRRGASLLARRTRIVPVEWTKVAWISGAVAGGVRSRQIA